MDICQVTRPWIIILYTTMHYRNNIITDDTIHSSHSHFHVNQKISNKNDYDKYPTHNDSYHR